MNRLPRFSRLLRDLLVLGSALWLLSAATPAPSLEPKLLLSPQVSSAAPEALKASQSSKHPAVPRLWWLAGATLLLGGGLILIARHPGLKGLGRMQMQGLILLRQSPAWVAGSSAPASGEADFERQYRIFSAAYALLGLKLTFSSDGMKIELGSPKAVSVLRSGVPQRLQQELQTLLDTLPPDKYFVQVQIDGKISGPTAILTFSLANHGSQVGLHLDKISRLTFKGVFFNG